MPEEVTPGTPGQGTGEGSAFDYEQGYNQIRPEFTRVTQELSSVRDNLSEYEQLFAALSDSDPEVQAAAMSALGFELDTAQPPAKSNEANEFVDPLERELQELRGVVDELRSARESDEFTRESQELTDLRDQFIGDAIGLIEDGLKPQFGDNFQFSGREEEALGNLAIAMKDAKGVPDVEGAYSLLYGNDGVLETNRARWIATKTGAVAPPAGTSIPAEQRPKTARERANYIDERVAALERLQ